MSEADEDPAWDEAVASFATAKPVELVRGPRTVTVTVTRDGAERIGTSEQLDGFRVSAGSREAVWLAAKKALDGWLDPAVALEFVEAF
jgi:hypothetical protein